LIDNANHQGQTISTDFTSVNGQHQWPTVSQASQQRFQKRHEVRLGVNALVLQITTEAFDAAFYFTLVRRFLGHRLQVTFPTTDNAADHAGQGVHMSGLTTSQLLGIDLTQITSYATIYMVIITHGIPPLVCAESRSLSHVFLFRHILIRFLKKVSGSEFGDAVEVADEFRYEWTAVPQLFGTPFYVYAYAFGQLLALSLYDRYRQEGEPFKERYLALLAAGGSAPPVELLAGVGVDGRDADFWQGGFDLLARLMAQLG
jgi:hypothetical protein